MALIQLRGGTAATWTSANPVLALREPGVETDTFLMKIGNGATAWNSLPYATGGAGGGALGTPSSGNLVNCTGLPVTGITASTTSPLGVGSLNVGNASDTTITRSEAGLIAVEGVVIPTITGGKRIAVVSAVPGSPVADTVYIIDDAGAPRVATITSSATPTFNTNACDAVTITALAVAITSMTSGLTGTGRDFQKLMIRFRDNGTARAITWGASYENGTASLPTTTVAGKTLLVGLVYDSVDVKWACEATGSRA